MLLKDDSALEYTYTIQEDRGASLNKTITFSGLTNSECSEPHEAKLLRNGKFVACLTKEAESVVSIITNQYTRK